MYPEAEYIDRIAQLETEKQSLAKKVEELTAQLKWFQKQIFGKSSERRIFETPKEQLFLGEQFQKDEPEEEETQTIAEHERKKRNPCSVDGDNAKLFFDDNVPVEEIKLENPETKGLSEEDYEVISQKTSYRLAQRPAVYVILKYVRDVVKIKKDKEKERILCPAAPDSVFEKSHADVSFLAGLLIDKFLYHMPLYRQHQRLERAGVQVSRAWLSQLVHRCGNLVEPVYDALVESIRKSRVKIIDETPIKAGRKEKGVMRKAYFWPVMGHEGKEIVFFIRVRLRRPNRV
jgi:transposase